MFGSNTLEIAIGIITVYILVSTICSAVREGIESWLKTRAVYLEHGIRQLLNDQKGTALAKDFFQHPMISGLYNDKYKPGDDTIEPSLLTRGKNLPSYISSRNFALTLMDIAANGPVTDDVISTASTPIVSLEAIRQNVSKIDNPKIQRILLHAADMAQGDINKMQAALEDWFNSSMDRVSGWYKRSTQWVLFIIAIVVVVGMNINTIKIAHYLSNNETAQKIVVERATAMAKDTTAHSMNYETAKKSLDSLDLPMGWDAGPTSFYMNEKVSDGAWNTFWGPILGLLMTILAAMLGAPFWFDMLNKVTFIRSTIKPGEKATVQAAAPQLTPVPGAAAPQTQMAAAANDDHEDGCVCDVPPTTFTTDEELPESKGGIA